jgi:hypothetical protein
MNWIAKAVNMKTAAIVIIYFGKKGEILTSPSWLRVRLAFVFVGVHKVN